MNDKKALRYDAFISYRHSDPDKLIAEKLHRMLETFRVPKAVVKKGSPKRIARVFRDRDELPTSSNLADNICYALENSGYLIVVCSPRTPQSQWVMKEIETFAALHGRDRILTLLIEGEPQESFPDLLRFARKQTLNADGAVTEEVVEIEPLAADIRDRSVRGMLKKLRTEILRLLAPMLGCTFDDLKQRHRERVIRRILTISISLSLFFLGFGSFAGYQAYIINEQSILVQQQSEIVKEQAQKVQEQADELRIQIQKTLAGQSLYLSDVSLRLLSEGDRRTAIMVALEALPKNLDNPERPYVEEAEYALSEALQVYNYRFQVVPDIALKHDMPVNFIRISDDAKTAVSWAQDGYVYIWDTEYGHLKNKYFTNQRYPDKGDLAFRDDSTIVLDTGSKIVCLDINTLEVLWECMGYFHSFVMNADRTLLAAVGSTVIMLYPQTGEFLYDFSLSPHMEDSGSSFPFVSHSGFDPSGRYLCLGINNGNALVFDTAEETFIGPFKARSNYIRGMALSSDGRVAVASTPLKYDGLVPKDNGLIDIFSLSSGEKLLEVTLDGIVNNLSFRSDDPTVLIFTEFDRIHALDVESGELEYTFIHDGEVTNYSVSEDYIFSSSVDGTVRALVMAEGGFENGNFRITMQQGIDSFELCRGSIVISLVNSNKAYILRNLQSRDAVDLGQVGSTVERAYFSPDSSRMVTVEYSPGEAILWDMTRREKLGTLFEYDDGAINSVSFTDNASKIFVLTSTGEILLYDAETLQLIRERNLESIWNYCFSPDGSLCVLLTSGSIDVVNTSGLDLVASFPGYYLGCKYAVIDGGRIIISDDDSKTAVYDIESRSLVHEFSYGGVSSIAVSHDSKTIALAYKDKTVRIFDAQTFEEKLVIEGLYLDVKKLVFDASGSSIFISLDDNSIKRYDIASGKFTGDLPGHSDALDSMTFSKDGSLYVTRDKRGDCIIWRNDSNKKLGMIRMTDGMDPGFGYFVCGMEGRVEAIIPIYDLKGLVEEAERQLGGMTLTEEEKTRLFITE